ncbi:MAG TPA: ABC transporter substrate-binding protein [Candidatus Binatia bacterium]|nr:ABC transporter substrate-binding protein [Candidatus Binatia bacterium]
MKLSFAAILALFTALITQTVAGAKPIRIAIPGYNITQISFFVAKERGFFKDEGLDVELIQMTGTLANLALMTGEVPFTSVPTAAMTANLRGANLRVLFTTFERPLFWLYSRPQIRDVKELKNKKVGVGGLNQASYTLLRELLSNYGLEAGKDYTLIQAGDSAPRFMALTSGFIDATLMPLPWNFSAQEAGMHELVALSKADITAPTGSIVLREDLLRSEPQLVEQFTRATLKGLRYAIERRAGAIAALTQSLKIKDDLAAKGYDAARPALTADGTMSEPSQRKALDAVLKSAGVKEAPPLDKFFNFAIAKKVAGELQAKGWKP